MIHATGICRDSDEIATGLEDSRTHRYSCPSICLGNVGTTLLLFCLGFLTFHLQLLMLDHVKL
jgi:hypothetical protein